MCILLIFECQLLLNSHWTDRWHPQGTEELSSSPCCHSYKLLHNGRHTFLQTNANLAFFQNSNFRQGAKKFFFRVPFRWSELRDFPPAYTYSFKILCQPMCNEAFSMLTFQWMPSKWKINNSMNWGLWINQKAVSIIYPQISESWLHRVYMVLLKTMSGAWNISAFSRKLKRHNLKRCGLALHASCILIK